MSPFSMLLALFCVLCYTGQSFFNKLYSVSYSGPSSAATPVFACVYGAFVGLVTFVYNGFSFHAAPATLLLGLLNGLILFLFNLASISASRSGPYAFQSIMMLFGNILLPMAFSVALWGDRLSSLKILGIAVMLASFVLFNLQGLRFGSVKKGYYFWVFLLFLSNGAYGIVLDAQQRLLVQTQRNEMIIVTFFVSAVISVVYLLLTQHAAAASCFRMPRRTWAFTLGSSICAAAAVNTLMLTMRYVPSSVLYTISNGGVLVASAALGRAVLKEKLTPSMVAGIAVAVLSLIILSI